METVAIKWLCIPLFAGALLMAGWLARDFWGFRQRCKEVGADRAIAEMKAAPKGSPIPGIAVSVYAAVFSLATVKGLPFLAAFSLSNLSIALVFMVASAINLTRITKLKR